MQYQALYRKYRPKHFIDVVGQESIITVLRNSIKTNKIGHAYLFSGPRGTGKTSTAKIFASTINCLDIRDGEKCGECLICKDNNNVDIIEIDAASNNGVDEIREIRNNSKLLPTNSKFKVYIIDEVHMLSMGAFNALLKTLEEPPKHVIFILATTELQKVPLTIISRCQKFQFKKLTVDNIKQKLKEIVEKEKIDIEEDAISLIAELSDGGLRDAINTLDQATSLIDGKINTSKVADMNGIVSKEKLEEFTNFLFEKNIKSSLDFLEYLTTEGKNLILFCERLIVYLKDKMVKSVLNDNNCKINNYITYVYAFIDLENSLKKSLNQKILFEIKILELLNLNETLISSKQNDFQEETQTKKDNSSENIKENAVKIKKIDKKESEENDYKNPFSSKEENVLDYYSEVNKVRINNTLATANKHTLNAFKEVYNMINDFLTDSKFSDIALLLTNSKLAAASDKYIIITLQDYSSKNFLLNNLQKVEKFIKTVFKNEIKPCFLTFDEWVTTKEEYKDKIRNNIKYEIKKEPEYNNKNKLNMSKIEETAMDIFGEDNIKLNQGDGK